VAKANTSEQLASLLGLQSVVLVDKASGEELGDIEEWSASNSTGGAAKVQLAGRAAIAAVGLKLPAGSNLPLLQQTVKSITALTGNTAAGEQEQQQTAATLQQEQQQHPSVLEDLLMTPVEASLQQVDQQPAVAAAAEASKAGMYRSSNPLLAARTAVGTSETSKTNAGAFLQLKSSAIAARMAGLESSQQQAQQ
jgi:hypothetical protein